MTRTDIELLNAAREMLSLLDKQSHTPTYEQTLRLRDAVAAAENKDHKS